MSVNGIVFVVAPGFDLHDQPVKSFNLSYRIKIGNDRRIVNSVIRFIFFIMLLLIQIVIHIKLQMIQD